MFSPAFLSQFNFFKLERKHTFFLVPIANYHREKIEKLNKEKKSQ